MREITIDLSVDGEELYSLYKLCGKGLLSAGLEMEIRNSWEAYANDRIDLIVDHLDKPIKALLLSILGPVAAKYRMHENTDGDFINLILSLENDLENGAVA